MFEQMLSSHLMRIVMSFGVVLMSVLAVAVRMKAANRPTSLRQILIPPLAMSTGFFMFIFPFARISVGYALTAFCAGLLLALPLISTSKFHVVNGEVYLKRSRAFIFILLGLLLLRLLLHPVVEKYVSVAQSGGIFFILAFGMLLLWRIAMAIRYQKLIHQMKTKSQQTNVNKQS